ECDRRRHQPQRLGVYVIAYRKALDRGTREIGAPKPVDILEKADRRGAALQRPAKRAQVGAEGGDEPDSSDDNTALHVRSRPTTTVALMPPKPNEFDNAWSTLCLLETFGT